MDEEEQLSDEEKQLLLEMAGKGFAPVPDEKHNVHTFLHSVATSKDTTKTGNLSELEIGVTRFSLRSYKEMALISSSLCNDEIMEEYFKRRGEILTATSLSKSGFLDQLAVIQRREIADMTAKQAMKENKGWFKKKEAPPGTQ